MSNIPSLRFSEFASAGSAQGAGEWVEKRLGDIFSFKNGINASREQYGKGYKFINVLDIINNNVITHDDIIGSVDVSKEIFEKNKVEYGNILFQRSSETRVDAGQTNVYLDKKYPSTFGGFIIRGQQKGNDYNPLFMNYMFKTQHSRKEITTKSNGSTRYNVGQETLSKVLVYLPQSKPEQQKIATFLSAVDSSIEQLTKKEKLLRAYKKGVMQKIFSREIRFRDDDGGVFDEWVEKRLGEVLKIGSGKDYKHLKSGDIPVYGTGGYMTSVDSYLYDGKSVCIGRKGTINKPILLNGKFWTVDTLFYTHSYNALLVEYLYHFALTINWLKYNEGTTLPSLSKKTIEKIKINLPSLKEQTKIANFLSSLDEKITQTHEALEAKKHFKKGLLQKMFV